MEKVQRVVVCGNSLALAGIRTSLGLDAGCEVVGLAMPASACALRELRPDVVIFDLDAVPHVLIYAFSKELPRSPGQSPLLMIGIDQETNRAMVWIEQQTEGWTSKDLANVIHHSGKAGPLKMPNQKDSLSSTTSSNKG